MAIKRPFYRLTAVSLLSSTLALTSCSFVERNTIGLFSADAAGAPFSSPQMLPARDLESEHNTAKVSIEPRSIQQSPPQAPGTRVEVIWEIPKDPVDGFIIRYGLTQTDLKFEEKVSAGDLDRFEDPKYGFVYRYVLRGVPNDKSVFVTLTAYYGAKQSAPSGVFEVAPKR